MTLHDYIVVMSKKAGVAELKSRLSYYLRMARGGTSVVVMDRGNPVAELVPYRQQPTKSLVVRERTPGAIRPGDVKPLPPILTTTQVDALLAEDRGDD